jgi:WD40 repeat protein
MDCRSWVNDVCWSPSGNTLAAVSHNSQVHIIDVRDMENVLGSTFQTRGLPFYKARLTSDENLFCCGYERIPIYYKKSGDQFKEHQKLDDVSTTKERQMTEIEYKRQIFEQKKLGKASEDIEFLKIIKTKHKNTIM